MAIHVAILKQPYIDAILAGRKTVESRMTINRQPPFEQISTGERLYFKQSAGPFRAIATAGHIEFHANVTPDQFQRLEQRMRPRVGGDDAYWTGKQKSRYLTFIDLCDVEPIDLGPAYPKSAWRAWHILDEEADPVRDIVLSEGAIRNNYLIVRDPSPAMRQAELTLELPDQAIIETRIVNGSRLKWRGWRTYFRQHDLKPGDVVRLECLQQHRYRVRFLPRPGGDLTWHNEKQNQNKSSSGPDSVTS